MVVHVSMRATVAAINNPASRTLLPATDILSRDRCHPGLFLLWCRMRPYVFAVLMLKSSTVSRTSCHCTCGCRLLPRIPSMLRVLELLVRVGPEYVPDTAL
eukprot:5980371-Pyramimonas_sp.AAC.1